MSFLFSFASFWFLIKNTVLWQAKNYYISMSNFVCLRPEFGLGMKSRKVLFRSASLWQCQLFVYKNLSYFCSWPSRDIILRSFGFHSPESKSYLGTSDWRLWIIQLHWIFHTSPILETVCEWFSIGQQS